MGKSDEQIREEIIKINISQLEMMIDEGRQVIEAKILIKALTA